jgi:hypothetical protein
MSTLKAKTIQPVSDSDTLVLRTGATDSLTVDTNGNTTIRGELIVDGLNIGQGVGNYTTNTRVGLAALASTTTPTVDPPWNTAFGRSALNANSTGYYNTGIGGQSLRDTTEGFENTAVGLNSGVNNTTGNYNTAIGSQAGPDRGSLNQTTCVGRLAVASASNSVALGFEASATQANSIYLGNSTVDKLFMGNGSDVAPAFVGRAWVVFDTNKNAAGTAETTLTATNRYIRRGGNVASVNRDSAGLFTVTFTTPMPHADYVVLCSAAANLQNCSLTVVLSAGNLSSNAAYNTVTSPLQPYNKTVNGFTIHSGSTVNGNRADANGNPISVLVFA